MNTGNESEMIVESSAVEQASSYSSGGYGGTGVLAGGAEPASGSSSDDAAGESPVNYEEAALLELELDGTDYRIDVGRAGTALCISTRPSGSWSWVFRGEAKWQVSQLRCRALDRDVLTRLSRALAEAAADSQS
jgi:hypothetical protein